MAPSWHRHPLRPRRLNDARGVVLDQPGSKLAPGVRQDRPGLIVSNTAHNEILDSVVVVPLSTIPGEIWPLRIGTDAVRGNPSFAVLPESVKCRSRDLPTTSAPQRRRSWSASTARSPSTSAIDTGFRPVASGRRQLLCGAALPPCGPGPGGRCDGGFWRTGAVVPCSGRLSCLLACLTGRARTRR